MGQGEVVRRSIGWRLGEDCLQLQLFCILSRLSAQNYKCDLQHKFAAFFTEKDVYTWTLQTDIHKVHTFKFNRETCTKLFSSCCYDSPALDFLFFSLAGSPSHPGQQ